MKTLTLTGVLEGKDLKCAGNIEFVGGKCEIEKDDDADKVYLGLRRYYPMKISAPVADKEPAVHAHVPDELDVKVTEAEKEMKATAAKEVKKETAK